MELRKIHLTGKTADRCKVLIDKYCAKGAEFSDADALQLIALLLIQLANQTEISERLFDDVSDILIAHKNKDAIAVVEAVIKLSRQFDESQPQAANLH